MTAKYTQVAFMDGDRYTSFCPEIKGCMAQGDTMQEAMDNLVLAIIDMCAFLTERGESIPEPTGIVNIDFDNFWSA